MPNSASASHFSLPIATRRILFVGGKGGVGKTTVAAALALRMAEGGERVLLVSTDPAHSLGDLFGEAIGDRERELLPGLAAMEIDPEAEVERYLARVTRTMRDFVRPEMYPEIERQMGLTRHSPGAEEAALLDRVAALMERIGTETGGARTETGYDRIIFDTAPTGHTLRLLALPEIMAAWTDGLLRGRERSDALARAVARLGTRGTASSPGVESASSPDAADTPAGRRAGGPAPRPGDELSLIDQVHDGPADERGRRIRDVLLERRRRFAAARRLLLDRERTAFVLVLIPERLPILETVKALDVLREHGVPVAGLVVNRVLPDAPLGEFLERRRAQEQEYLARIARELGGLPRVDVPLLAHDVQGWDALRELGARL